MEQVIFLLTEYYNWIILAGCALTLILLVAALHRIKKLGKRVDELSAKNSRVLECAEYAAQAHRREEEEMERLKRNGSAYGAARGDGGWPGEDERADKPEELIDAVLGEVFP